MLNINDYRWNVNLVNGKVSNIINNDVDKIKTKFGKEYLVQTSLYYEFINYLTYNNIYILPIIFHKPDTEDGILYYVGPDDTADVNISYLCMRWLSGEIKQGSYPKDNNHGVEKYYSIINENGYIDPYKLYSHVTNNKEALKNIDGFDGNLGLVGCKKLIEYTFFRDINDDKPIKWISSDYLYFIDGNDIDRVQISTSYFTYDVDSRIVIFRDDCFFLPNDYKKYMVNKSDNIKGQGSSSNNFENYWTLNYNFFFGNTQTNVCLSRWFTSKENCSDCWYTHGYFLIKAIY